MKYPQMIKSLLETDMYKFSMGQCIYHQFPDYMTKWRFKCRNTDVIFTEEMVDEIKAQIDAYCDLRFTEDELAYLGQIPWIRPAYVNFLRLWHPRRNDIVVLHTDTGCHLEIETYGTWLNTSMYEIAILAIVNEVYFRSAFNYDELLEAHFHNADVKCAKIIRGDYDLSFFSEFGLRRRLGGDAQEYAVRLLANNNHMYNGSIFVGTSNVFLAKLLGIKPVGTMAHEAPTCIGEGNHKINPAYSNYYMMEAWVKEYKTQNGIYLTDLLGTDVFLRDFDLTFATLFSGVRHDSGDPIKWGEKIIAHYEKLGIDPANKTLLFSDSLNFEKATKIRQHFGNRAKIAFGIGTYIANDANVTPLNIICKVVECNGVPTAKISDDPGKSVCDDKNYLEYLKRSIDWRLNHTND